MPSLPQKLGDVNLVVEVSTADQLQCIYKVGPYQL